MKIYLDLKVLVNYTNICNIFTENITSINNTNINTINNSIIISDNIYKLLNYSVDRSNLIVSIGELYINNNENIVSILDLENDIINGLLNCMSYKNSNTITSGIQYLTDKLNIKYSINIINLDKTKYITHSDIINCNPSFNTIISLVKNNIINKNLHQIPPKISIPIENNGFYNTMPCIKNGLYSCKVVIRNFNNRPLLSGHIYLYDIINSKLISILDSKWITSIRTGVIAGITIDALAIKNFNSIAFIGLGNCAISTLLCVSSLYPTKQLIVKLLKYKDTTEHFINRFKDFKNIKFIIIDNFNTLCNNTDVIVSSVSSQTSLFSNSTDIYKKGVLIVPIQTRGFQNCDIAFDKIVVDDVPHIKHFKNYSKMKSVIELSDILNKKYIGRNNDIQRILAYNIGLGVHDNSLASYIYMLLSNANLESFSNIDYTNGHKIIV